SVALLEQLRAECPTVIEYRAYHANSLRMLGHYLAVYCHNSQGLKYQDDAIAVFKELTAEFPRDPTYRFVLGTAYCRISQAQPPREAEKSLRKALEEQRRMVADFPSVSEYRYDVMRSLYMLASDVLDNGRAEEVEQAYTE